MRKNKFTLIELLVVIAMIGVLISMLFPALSKAREKTKVAVCLNNHKQISIANFTYLTSNSGYYPTAAPFDDLLSLYDGRNLSQTEINIGELPASYENGIYHCPAAKAENDEDPKLANRSYGINGGSNKRLKSGRGLTWQGHEGNPWIATEAAKSRNMSEVVSPSGTFFLGERDMPSPRPWNNIMGSTRNAHITIQEYDVGSVQDFITGTQLLVSYDTHGQYKLTFSKADGSALLMNYLEFSKSPYWFYDE
jgi:prepilin-type N-terminal cleavage/methylation domain-containing protein